MDAADTTLRVGSVVWLRSGGTPMTIISMNANYPDEPRFLEAHGHVVEVAYFVDKEIRRETFPLEALQPVPEEYAKAFVEGKL